MIWFGAGITELTRFEAATTKSGATTRGGTGAGIDNYICESSIIHPNRLGGKFTVFRLSYSIISDA